MKLAFNTLTMKGDSNNKDLFPDHIAKEEEVPSSKSEISAIKPIELFHHSKSVIQYAPKNSASTSETVNNHVSTALTSEAFQISRTDFPKDSNPAKIPEASSNLKVTAQLNCLVPKKRKSLELLANSLMKKAALVAHTTAIPSKDSDQADKSRDINGLNKNNCVSKGGES